MGEASFFGQGTGEENNSKPQIILITEEEDKVFRKKKGAIIFVIAVSLLILISCNSIEDSNNGSIGNNEAAFFTSTTVEKENMTLDPPDATNIVEDEQIANNTSDVFEYNGISYKIIIVDGGDLSGERQPNVAVDVGYGNRVYWGLTNEHKQLVYVIAEKIVLQDAENEEVLSNGRYYPDEAKVPGTEQKDLDEGHVIADSLGGVSNAYNITPQNYVLNRNGDQAYMEKVIRDAEGCENFVATITYPGTTTQIPSQYKYEYEINDEKIVDEFDNVNPDEVNASLITETPVADTESEEEELAKIDTNGNGKVTIAEAKTAGYSMPIYSDCWLYKYMDDRDKDGMVGE